MKLIPFLLLPFLAGCSDLPSFEATSIPSPVLSSSAAEDVSPIETSLLDVDAEFYASGGGDVVEASPTSSLPLPGVLKPEGITLEFVDADLWDVASKIVVHDAGKALVMSVEEPVLVSVSGGPFAPDEALAALGEVVASQNLNMKTVGDIVMISDGSSRSSSTGFSRVYRTSAKAIAEAVDSLFPELSARNVGRSVAVSGVSGDVLEAIKLVHELDRSAVSSLPWVVVRVSPGLAAEASAVVETLSDADDPLAVSALSPNDNGLVLLVGHSAASVSEAAEVLRSLDSGKPKRISKTLPVLDPATARAAIEGAFSAEIEDGSLLLSSSASELVFRGFPGIVADAYNLADKLHGGADFVEVRAVVVETVRGSALDRSISVSGGSGGFELSSGGGGASDLLRLTSGGFSAALSWLDRDTETKILATPRLSVSSGGSAELSVGSQVPIYGASVEEDGKTTQGIEYRDVGVLLSVSPSVLSDGRISVSLSQSLSSAGANALTGIDSPVFDRRSLTTELVFEPGELVAAGGLDYSVSEESRAAPFAFNPSGMSSARKLVVLLTADVAGTQARADSVQEALLGLSEVLTVGGSAQ